MNWRYTNIQHGPRLSIGVTPNEYCVLDLYYQTQSSPIYGVDGWSENTYQQIADFLGFSKGAVFKMVDRFVKMGLMEVNPANSKQKKTTKEWYMIAYERVSKVNMEEIKVSKVNEKVSKVNAPRFQSERHIDKREYKEEIKERGARALISEKELDRVEEGIAPTPGSAAPPSPQEEFIKRATLGDGSFASFIKGPKHPEGLPPFEQGSTEAYESILSRVADNLKERGDWHTLVSSAGLKMTKEQFFTELKSWIRRNQNSYPFYCRPEKVIRGGRASFASWLNNDISRGKYSANPKSLPSKPTPISRSPIRKKFTHISQIA